MIADALTPRLDAQHRYWLGEQQIVGTTTALKLAGLIDDRWYNTEALQRGSYVHQMVHYDVDRDLDEASIDPRLLGYLQASRKFKDAAGIENPTAERIMADPILQLGGTSDLIGQMFRRPAIADWKTGQPYAWHAIQLAIYEHLAKASGIVPKTERLARFVVYLRADGTFTFRECDDPRDLQVGLAALHVAQFKLRQAVNRRFAETDEDLID